MSMNKKEAFFHNSCKKVAQLVKVITLMTDDAIDRRKEKISIQDHYEEEINKIFSDYMKKMNEIHAELVRFRKSCIDKKCGEYGALYKRLKADYSEEVGQQQQKISDIYEDIESVANEVARLRAAIEAAENEVTMEADALFSEVKSGRTKRGEAEWERATREWDQKTQAVLDAFEQTMKNLKASHARQLKQLRAEMNRVFKSVARERKDEFIPMRDGIHELRTDCSAMRKRILALIKEHQKVSRANTEQRNAVYDQTCRECDEVTKKYNETLAQGKRESAARAKELSELSKAFSDTCAAHKALLERYQRHIDDKYKKMAKLRSRSNADNGKRKDAEESVQQEMLMGFAKEEADYKAFCEGQQKKFAELAEKLNALLASCESNSESAMETLNENYSAIEKKIEKFLSNQRALVKEEFDSVTQKFDSVLRSLRKHIKEIESRESNDLAAQKKLNQDLQVQLEDAKKNNSIEEEKKQEQTGEELKKLAERNRKKAATKVHNNSTAAKQRQTDYEKRLKEMQDKFSRELTTKQTEFKQKSDDKIHEVKREAKKDLKVFPDLKNFEIERDKLTGGLEYAKKKIEQVKAEGQTLMTRLQNDYTAAEKAQRQLQRRIETEIRQVDDDFEIKIQVEQVSLREKIENISKLYDAEENRRGVEVIEMIRKVKETRNRVDDFLRRKNAELADLVKENNKNLKTYQREIEKMKNHELERQLKEELNKQMSEFNATMEGISKKEVDQIDKIDRQIKQIQEDTEKEIQKIKEEEEKRLTEISDEIETVKKKISEVSKETTMKKEEIDKNHQEKLKELEVRHERDRQKLVNRIENAKSRQAEMTQDSEKGEQEIKEKIQGVSVTIATKYVQTLQAAKAKKAEQAKNVHIQIRQMCESIVPTANQTGIVMTVESRNKVSSLKKELRRATTKVDDQFERFFALFENGPTVPEESRQNSREQLVKTGRPVLPPLEY